MQEVGPRWRSRHSLPLRRGRLRWLLAAPKPLAVRGRPISTLSAPSARASAPSVHHSAKLRHSGANPSKREAKGHAAALRALGHTHISAAVLQAALRDFREAHPPDEERAALEEAWAVVDADGDGAVRGEEVHAMLDLVLTQGEPLTAEETAAFWAEVDTDADGEVTKAEFMRMLAADGGGGGGGGGGGEAKGDSEGGGDAARNEHAPL